MWMTLFQGNHVSLIHFAGFLIFLYVLLAQVFANYMIHSVDFRYRFKVIRSFVEHLRATCTWEIK